MIEYYSYALIALLFISLITGALFFSNMHVEQEKQREEIAKAQLIKAIDLQYRFMGEEFWSQNYESIFLRVQDIAKSIGGAEFELSLYDEDFECVLSKNNFGRDINCKKQIGTLKNLNSKVDSYKFRNTENGYHYLVGLGVGDITKGYLSLKISDVYGFFKGDALTYAMDSFIPFITLILILCIGGIYLSRKRLLGPYLNSILEMRKKEALNETAYQVAHDIRSPVSKLERLIDSNKEDLDSEFLNSINSTLKRISDISTHLMSKFKYEQTLGLDEAVSDVKTLTKQAVTELRADFYKCGIKFNYEIDKTSSFYTKMNHSKFISMISNILRNSVESMDKEKKEISLEIAEDSKKNFLITITDNGKGIPESEITKIGTRGFSFGKTNGNGIGLYSAIKEIEAIGGEFEISSIEGEGTKIIIKLPNEMKPVFFCDKIRVSNKKVIVIDDDENIHDQWSKRFNIFKSFFKASSFLDWANDQESLDEYLFLVDYEFFGEDTNGIELIKELKLKKKILVSNHHFNQKVIKKCIANQISFLPKPNIDTVEIINDIPMVILVEDDDLNQKVWQIQLKKLNLNYKIFETAEDVVSKIPEIPKDSKFFVDNVLAGEMKGVELANQLDSEGFRDIYFISAVPNQEMKFPVLGKEFQREIIYA